MLRYFECLSVFPTLNIVKKCIKNLISFKFNWNDIHS